MTTISSPDHVAVLMGRFRQGDRAAAGELVDLFYPELRRIAAARMRDEKQDHTWQPTVLVNELYLELLKIKALRAGDGDGEAERQAFLNLAAYLMKRLLITHARRLNKRVVKTGLYDGLESGEQGMETVAAIDSCLDRLAKVNPQMRTLVELRVFEGLPVNEAAERMGVSPRTAARYWAFAQEWLAVELGGAPEA
ncbi:MAG: RNA polymerase subunit sigma-70 [Acidobacteria bacterium]|nr:RNA polymerase subunit sigma-70 [Acidobacteriota bacterium]